LINRSITQSLTHAVICCFKQIRPYDRKANSEIRNATHVALFMAYIINVVTDQTHVVSTSVKM